MKIDPTQKRDNHCKVYLEKDVVDAIKTYQSKNGFKHSSFSETLRSLLLSGLSAEEQKGSAKIVTGGVTAGNIKIYHNPIHDPRNLMPGPRNS